MSSFQPSSLPAAESPAPTPSKEYFCDGQCQKSIHAESPRVHCLTCPDYDLCANCALGERFGGYHMAAHPTSIYRVSGDTTLFAVRSKASLTYPSSSQPQHGLLGSANGAPFVSVGGTLSSGSTSAGGANNSFSGTSSSEALPGSTTSFISPGSTVAAPDGWNPFFDADMNPTPTFFELTSAIFTHLDTVNTGFLTPETYAQLLDDMGYPLQDNIWKSNLGHPMLSQTPEAPADAALKQALELLGIQHNLQPRPSPSSPDAHGQSPENEPHTLNVFQRTAPPPGPMPLLPPPALASLLSMALLADPTIGYSRLKHILRMYGVDGVEPWRRWGEVPRGVLPQTPDVRMVERMSAVGAHVQSGQNQGSGNAAAINAIGGSHRY
ncbi:hypothetical protein B0H19DRAFT_1185362 [Mycena capillaripes]|nr:hypothetical protein B0H19DRAFT_1185362 [Mycena capillaripes]